MIRFCVKFVHLLNIITVLIFALLDGVAVFFNCRVIFTRIGCVYGLSLDYFHGYAILLWNYRFEI